MGRERIATPQDAIAGHDEGAFDERCRRRMLLRQYRAYVLRPRFR